LKKKLPKTTESKNKSKHAGGRPPKKESKKIDAELWPYFQKGYSVEFTSLETKHEWHTVNDRFEKWTQAHIINTDFSEIQLAAKKRVVISFDKCIERFHKALDRLDESLDDEKQGIFATGQYARVNQMLTDLYDKKARIEMQPTLQDSLEVYIAHKLAEADEKLKIMVVEKPVVS